MKRILSLISMLVIFCIITASMSIVSFAESPYDTAEDTYAHKGSKGLSYTITSYDECSGVSEDEIKALYNQNISTGLYTNSANVSPTLTIDLGSEKLVKRITFLGDGAYAQCGMNQTVSYSVDGVIWKSEDYVKRTQSKAPATYNHAIYSTGWGYLNEYSMSRFCARYLKITLSESNTYNIKEIAIYGADPADSSKSYGIGYDIISHSTVSGVTDDEWSALNDGNNGPNYVSSTELGLTTSPEMVIDLGDVMDVDSIVAYGNASKNYCRFSKFEASLDNVNWKTVSHTKDETGSCSLLYLNTSTYQPYANRYEFSAEKNYARYLKLYIYPTKSQLQMREVCVFASSVTNYPALKSLTASEGTFTESFDADVTSYKLQVEDFANLPTLSFEALMVGATAELTQSPSADNNYTATITVTHGTETKAYTVELVEYNWALAANKTTVTSGYEALADADLETKAYVKNETPLVITLDDFVEIEKIRVASSGTTAARNWGLSYSLDGENWVVVENNVNCVASTTTVDEVKRLQYVPYAPVVAKYLKFAPIEVDKNFNVEEFEIFGSKVNSEDVYVASSGKAVEKLHANITFFNKTEESKANSYYFMAVYVDDVLYTVVPNDKSGEIVNAGKVASASFVSKNLPATGNVTAKIFVWSGLDTLTPVTAEPIPLG